MVVMVGGAWHAIRVKSVLRNLVSGLLVGNSDNDSNNKGEFILTVTGDKVG